MATTEKANPSMDTMKSGTDKTSKRRHRASVACVTCREKRTKCVVQNGETLFVLPRAQTRIHPPPEAEPECATQNFAEPLLELNYPSKNSVSDRKSKSPSGGSIRKPSPVSKRSSTVHKLLSTRGHLSFDQLAGRLHYFVPTTNCHVLSVTQLPEEGLRHVQTQGRRTQRILSTLSQNVQEYLMGLFWQYYNPVIHVIDRKAFEEGKDSGAGPFYSGFLHIYILAAGYRFADKQRPDMLSLTLPDRESMLHREAKYMLDYEMERPGGIPFIGALFLLGDPEVGCGRDNVGWLYSEMACRLCFDIGLHLDRSLGFLKKILKLAA
ncbi:uncharacterized protein N7483_011171 [Penicillium malachiteum]|uniref:uncharacterized protein n=1 Tax=Penicillium malachiteum TaxID=1324776 RepID=UPI0025499E63|nr:uncharacterized protein N7483_011171 [Penicillium malachiteum]KAJ5713990.1 hypothetical protein N7483_011171 [Penicillium malachiteum]